MPVLIGRVVEREWPLAAGLVAEDRFGAARVEPLSQLCAVVSRIAKQFFCWPGAAYQSWCGRAVMCLAAGQQEGRETAFSICDCMDFRVAPAARARANVLCLSYVVATR